MRNVPKITKFSVEGLFGENRVEIPIQDNKLLLVGENGTGKSTIVNLFYYFLSQQWLEMTKIDFQSVTLKISGKNLKVFREELVSHVRSKKRGRVGGRGLPLRYHQKLIESFSRSELEDIAEMPSNMVAASEYLPRLGLRKNARGPAMDLKSSVKIILSEQFSIFENDNLDEVSNFLTSKISSRIIYLPTYRRIEKELSSLVPDLDERVRDFQGRNSKRQRGTEYLELVEFGMEDIVQLINSKRQKSLETATAEFETLAGEFLHDVINGTANKFSISKITGLGDEYITSVLDRVDEKTLAIADKEKVKEFVENVRLSNSVGEENAQIGYLFSKILDAARKVEEEEKEVSKLVSICNRYLHNKRLIYDRNKYELSIQKQDKTKIQLQNLSSGEKQIFSLFCHLLLGLDSNFILIIDEPELSLSVSWQTHFLTDILELGKCDFIAAVTHSPFIFQNYLDDFAQDLGTLYESAM